MEDLRHEPGLGIFCNRFLELRQPWEEAITLEKIGSERAIDSLIEPLKGADEDMDRRASRALSKLNSTRVLKVALAAYQCPEFVQARADLLNIIKATDRALRAQRPVEHA